MPLSPGISPFLKALVRSSHFLGEIRLFYRKRGKIQPFLKIRRLAKKVDHLTKGLPSFSISIVRQKPQKCDFSQVKVFIFIAKKFRRIYSSPGIYILVARYLYTRRRVFIYSSPGIYILVTSPKSRSEGVFGDPIFG